VSYSLPLVSNLNELSKPTAVIYAKLVVMSWKRCKTQTCLQQLFSMLHALYQMAHPCIINGHSNIFMARHNSSFISLSHSWALSLKWL